MNKYIFFMPLFLIASPLSASADEYRVYRSQLECVLANAEKYLNLPGDVITIVLPACPIADALEAFRSLAQNNAFKRDDNDREKLDAILTIKKSQLPCILDMVKSTNADPLEISTDETCTK